jgi:long-chain fatty acid transport protein
MRPLLQRSAIALSLLAANQSLAGGLWLNEFGDFAGGRASAGASAGTDEATTILHNPASVGRIEGKRLQVSGVAFIPKVRFDVDNSDPLLGNNDGGQSGKNAPGAGFFYIHDLDSEKWSLGVSLAGLAGAGLDYDKQWVGRYQSTDVELLLMVMGFVVSYQVTDKFSVGVAPQAYYSKLEMKLGVPTGLITGNLEQDDGKAKIDGDDTGFSFLAGATYDFSDATRVGIRYQSKIDIKYGGDLKLNPGDLKASSDTELPFAANIRGGLHHDLNDRLGLDLTVGWDDWSTLEHVIVSVDTIGGAGLEKNWEDTYHYALGFQYKLDDDWDLTAGIAYDTSPVSASDRTADLPVDRQVRYTAGARYDFSETFNVGGYVEYIDLGSAKIHGEFWNGKYSDNEVYSFAVFGEWKL